MVHVCVVLNGGVWGILKFSKHWSEKVLLPHAHHFLLSAIFCSSFFLIS